MRNIFKELKEWVSFRDIKAANKRVVDYSKPIIDYKTTQFAEERPIIGHIETTFASNFTYATEENFEKIKENIGRYRRMEFIPLVDQAIEIITNEALLPDTENIIVKLNLSAVDNLSTGIKNKMEKSFAKILKLMHFNKKFHEIFRCWYVDGKFYYNVVIDPQNVDKGIIKLIYVDPVAIQPIFTMDGPDNREIKYQYTDIRNNTTSTVSPDFVAGCGSNVFDRFENLEVSNLHKSIKSVNDFRNIESSIVIYRLVRSSEKRVFTISTGLMNNASAMAKIREIASGLRNKFAYDTRTGEVKTEKDAQLITEDIFLGQKSNGEGTKVDLLDGGKGLTELDDLYYFEQKVYKDLNIPASRLDKQNKYVYTTGREIERDEIQFFKFITRLRTQFSELFNELLKRELVWTKVMSVDEFDDIRDNIEYIFTNDNLYQEIKESELLQMRIQNLGLIDPFVGKYYTRNYIAQNVLKIPEEEWKEKQEELKKDRETINGINKEMGFIPDEQGGGNVMQNYNLDMGMNDDEPGKPEYYRDSNGES